MERKIFISFLGIGDDGDGYASLKYSYKGTPIDCQTEFVQRAEIEAVGADKIDKILIICTKESYKDFFTDLKSELVNGLSINEAKIETERINKKFDADDQWKLFSLVNKSINDGDRVIFDFTHGFRSLPIILSASLNYITKSKPNVVLEHVFYGQKDSDTAGTIIDMKEFYMINEWADGVSKLIDNADTTKLAKLASIKTEDSFSGLKDVEFISALEELTGTIKNIDVNSVAEKTNNALEIIKQKLDTLTNPEEQELLRHVLDKFATLSTDIPPSGYYDKDYFEVQLKLVEMLIQHELFMQAFTVMRELIVSIGMTGCTGKYRGKEIDSDKGRKYRRRFGEMFVNLCQFSVPEWKYMDGGKIEKISEMEMDDFKNIMQPFYLKLEEKNIAEILQSFVSDLLKYRNGFDHGWTCVSKKNIPEDISEQSNNFLGKITQVVKMMNEKTLYNVVGG